jgi:hypothetical protein
LQLLGVDAAETVEGESIPLNPWLPNPLPPSLLGKGE